MRYECQKCTSFELMVNKKICLAWVSIVINSCLSLTLCVYTLWMYTFFCRSSSGMFHQTLMNQLVSLWSIFFLSTILITISLIRSHLVTTLLKFIHHLKFQVSNFMNTYKPCVSVWKGGFGGCFLDYKVFTRVTQLESDNNNERNALVELPMKFIRLYRSWLFFSVDFL